MKFRFQPDPMIYVVVGGGIAGVSCIKRLLVSLHESDNIVLVSASKRVKTVRHWARVSFNFQYK